MSTNNKAEQQPAEASSSGESQSADAPSYSDADERGASHDPVRRYTRIVLAVVAFLFVWYVLADRYAPWTDQARVQAYIVPISPKVAGKVTQVNVVQDQVVKAGEVLVQIDRRDYELAVQGAEAALERAGQEIGASTDEVAVAEARLSETRTQLAYAQQQARRYLELAKKGVISKADADRTRTEVDAAQAQVASARAALDKAKEQLGRQGADNPKIREALAALEQARINLRETSLVAPTAGGITNLKIDIGHYANAGQPLMTFVSSTDVWVQANLRENSIANIKAGDAVDIALDVAPGRVFSGTVSSVGYAVKQPSGGAAGEAVTVQGTSGWLRDAQRFPVIIHFTDESARGLRRAGGQADVQIYTGSSNFLLNTLGRIWIRLMSLLSFIY